MSEKYELYKQKKYRQAVQKLTNLVTQKKISRTQLIAFLNRHEGIYGRLSILCHQAY